MELLSLEDELKDNTYPGRGIVIGLTGDGTKAVAAYFIMGRSENSRNRVFVADGDGIRTEAFEPEKMEDPSLIIYAPVRVSGADTVVTNGDQTDTIIDALRWGMRLDEALLPRTFEPDAPNYTPRISALMHIADGKFSYQLSILKSDRSDPKSCLRYTFSYEDPLPGAGRFIHTYMHDGNPLPSFEGEPKPVAIPQDIAEFTDLLWQNLDPDNKVSLFVRYIDIASGVSKTRIVNKHER